MDETGHIHMILCNTRNGGKRALEAFPVSGVTKPKVFDLSNKDQQWVVRSIGGGLFTFLCDTRNRGKIALEAFPREDLARTKQPNDKENDQKFMLQSIGQNRYYILCNTNSMGWRALEAFPKDDCVRMRPQNLLEQDQIWYFDPPLTPAYAVSEVSEGKLLLHLDSGDLVFVAQPSRLLLRTENILEHALPYLSRVIGQNATVLLNNLNSINDGNYLLCKKRSNIITLKRGRFTETSLTYHQLDGDIWFKIFGVCFDLIFVLTGWRNAKNNVNPEALRQIFSTENIAVIGLEHMVTEVLEAATTWDKCLAFLHIIHAFFTTGMIEAALKAFLTSLSPLDALLYGIASVATLLIVAASDGMAAVGYIMIEIDNILFLIKDLGELFEELRKQTRKK